MTTVLTDAIEVRTFSGHDLPRQWPRWEPFVARLGPVPLSYHPSWPSILQGGLGHVPYTLEAVEGDELRGILPLAFVRGLLFGRFLVGLPYLNYGGVLADDTEAASRLVDRALGLASELDVRYLELRHERPVNHPGLTGQAGTKVHMRLPLPSQSKELWKKLSPKVRNQVRKGQKSGLEVVWGGEERLSDFYHVFSTNMRDLGTPVFSRRLFQAIVRQFPGRGEFCIVRADGRPAAAALLLHGWGVSEVPSASSLRRYNPSCANMLLYWNLLERAVGRAQAAFDFGRSSPGSNTYQFKKQWGAAPHPAHWQYHLRSGSVSDMRPDNPRYQRLVRLWRKLPVPLTRWIGPPIVRGIP